MTELSLEERVAVALCEEMSAFGCACVDQDARLCPLMMGRARTAIRAMRTPTVAMLVASLPATDQPADDKAQRLAAQACFLLTKKPVSDAVDGAGREAALELIRDWRSMIDAAGVP